MRVTVIGLERNSLEKGRVKTSAERRKRKIRAGGKRKEVKIAKTVDYMTGRKENEGFVMVVSGCHILFLKIVISLDSLECVFSCFHTYVSVLRKSCPQHIRMYNGFFKLNRCTNKD